MCGRYVSKEEAAIERVCPVSERVNNVKNDDASLIQAV